MIQFGNKIFLCTFIVFPSLPMPLIIVFVHFFSTWRSNCSSVTGCAEVIVRASPVERKGSYTILRVLICCTFCDVRGEPKHLKGG